MRAGRAWWPAVASSLVQLVARWSGAAPAAVRHAWRTGSAVIGAAMPHKMRPACGLLPHTMLATAAAVRPPSGNVLGSVATADFF
ncbi:hypothetical protein F511_45851 [Dorcoceras hygrometricum]|uniref:Secreted protein n=1 Tax=Dorcoceras hygrometricum TaxID=472368 RepID=A0A2Z6ZUY5_9LAMI|nr:hypothetical protein F511_45851 [Dorcoceras hygrometricum]